ncbi:MAG: hypothetical protein GY711_09420 [bacterium]|nr:hypothetical protein [bacterium]
MRERTPAKAASTPGRRRGRVRALGRPAAAWQHFLDAIELDPQGEVARSAREGLSTIEAMQKRRARMHGRG